MANINYKGFTQLDNTILFDSNLSADAKVFLMQIRHILKTKQESFKPTKGFILKSCAISEKMYRKVMKELKGFVELVKTRVGRSYEYTYNLLKDIFTPVVNKAKKVLEKVNTVSEGQLTVNDTPDRKYKNHNNHNNKVSTFTNYSQREYDYKKLEEEILGWWDD